LSFSSFSIFAEKKILSEGKSFKLLPHLAPTKRLFVGLAKKPEKEEIKKKIDRKVKNRKVGII
jgi:hypothetical protein